MVSIRTVTFDRLIACFCTFLNKSSVKCRRCIVLLPYKEHLVLSIIQLTSQISRLTIRREHFMISPNSLLWKRKRHVIKKRHVVKNVTLERT